MRRNHPQARNIRAPPRKHPKRHDGGIPHNQRTRYTRQHKRDPHARAAATRAAGPFRSRIVKEPEARSLHPKNALSSSGSCQLFPTPCALSSRDRVER
jgi:hypothetical protein